ncbi:MAG: YcgN family cysteine cluster protein [Anaerolineaceae bacterium]|jgi:uncharacterized cysteine cluster protein YcgN (CxxCxxCC family)|nr:YcgN family cysteine cluster protein [Anaerolineaceae bacterium]
MTQPFWEAKQLEEMSVAEWELLCDHCGRCCLHKVEDEEGGGVYFTSIVCKLYDLKNGGCRAYAHRSVFVPTCVVLSVENVAELNFMPKTCAYRLLQEGKPLPAWHPLVSGSRLSARKAGIAILSFAILETEIDMDHLEGFILDSDL